MTYERWRGHGPAWLIGLAVLLLAASPVRAQNDADRKQAQALQVEGLRLLQKGDNRAALAKFEEAYRLVPSPKILFNRAKAHHALGESVEALTDFERFLDEAPYAQKEGRAEAERLAQVLRPTLSFIEIQIDDVGAKILIDSREIGMAPLARPVVVAPGAHEVRVEKAAMTTETRSVSPLAGQKVRVYVRLSPEGAAHAEAAAPATAPARTEATETATPEAGSAAGATGASNPSATLATSPASSAGRPWQITATWITAGVGAVVLGGAITAQILSDLKNEEFNNTTTPSKCNEMLPNDGGDHCKRLADAADLRFKLAMAGYAAAGAIVGGALILYLTAPSGSDGGRTVVAGCSPSAGASGLSCAMSVRF